MTIKLYTITYKTKDGLEMHLSFYTKEDAIACAEQVIAEGGQVLANGKKDFTI